MAIKQLSPKQTILFLVFMIIAAAVMLVVSYNLLKSEISFDKHKQFSNGYIIGPGEDAIHGNKYFTVSFTYNGKTVLGEVLAGFLHYYGDKVIVGYSTEFISSKDERNIAYFLGYVDYKIPKDSLWYTGTASIYDKNEDYVSKYNFDHIAFLAMSSILGFCCLVIIIIFPYLLMKQIFKK